MSEGSLHSDDPDYEEEYKPENEPLHISIILNRQVYFVGQKVEGEVIIDNPVRRKMRGVKLLLKSRGEVLWWSEGGKKNFSDTNFMQVENYLQGDGKMTHLEPGRQTLQFSIPLTSKYNLPSSMEFPHGHMRYTLKAEVDWPWAETRSCTRLVNVLNICNLREHRQALQPATFTAQCKVGILRQRLNISGRIEKIAFVPGEEILLQVEINNLTNRDFPNFSIRLNQIVEYVSSEGKQMATIRRVADQPYPAVKKNSDLCLTNETILVPPLPQSGLSVCEFLKLSYQVEITCYRCTASVLVYIGTLPTKNHYKRFSMWDDVEGKGEWPFADVKDLPAPAFDPTPNDPDVDYATISAIDENYAINHVYYQFDKERTLAMIETGEEEVSEDDLMQDDDSDAMSDFSL